MRSLDGAVDSATGGAHSGELGPTNVSLLRWHSLIAAWSAGAPSCSAQWHFVGSGQQHSIWTEIVRSCETGTANAHTIATRIVAAAVA